MAAARIMLMAPPPAAGLSGNGGEQHRYGNKKGSLAEEHFNSINPLSYIER